MQERVQASEFTNSNEASILVVTNQKLAGQTRRMNQNEAVRISLSALSDDLPSEKDCLTEPLTAEIKELRQEINDLTEYTSCLQVNE